MVCFEIIGTVMNNYREILRKSIFVGQAYHDYQVFYDNSFPHFDFETFMELARHLPINESSFTHFMQI